MRCHISILPQNYGDWGRFEASERHENVPSDPLTPDSEIVREYIRIGRQVEELGFDGIWTVEHHVTPYIMVPNPLQFLTYFAGCTERIELGTMVVVLPWHQPLRVAEDIAMLDHLMGDRRIVLGFGRGAGRREFESYSAKMAESRPRFLETLEIIRRALTGRFSFDGEFFSIPETEIRPRCKDPQKLFRDMRMAWGSPGSIPVGAEAGLKPMLVPQRPWSAYVPELAQYNKLTREAGFAAAGPIICLWMYCAETEEKAAEGARRYLTEYADSAVRNYELLGHHWDGVPTYENYAAVAAQSRKKTALEVVGDSAELRASNHCWGTPDQCVAKIEHLVELTGAEEVVLVPMFASMSYETANASMRLFAKEALPRVHALQPGRPVDEGLSAKSA
jgi:alkanesulfonate monooxygenase SsuD/methylene tetrahydromethanopterin reductase-like flavin-dependent oxidoreductase (luciferase family)